MKKQYVVFGADRFGCSVARTLENNGCEVIIVDNDPDQIEEIAEEVSHALVVDVEDPDAISALGLKNVDGAVIAMIEHMEASIVAAMICLEMGIKDITARAANEMHGRILKKIGVTHVVYPEQEMGERIGRYIAAQDFMDWIALSPEFSLVELAVHPEWVGRSLAELNLRSQYGINVVGLRKGDNIIMRFSPKEPITADMTLYAIGSNDDLEQVTE